MTDRLPNFLIVGVPKCGTTSLAAQLGRHPDVFMSAEKELHFFDTHWRLGVDWYRSQFALAGTATAVGEATPTYAVFDDVFVRVADELADARLVLMVRHPVERAYSHFWFNKWRDRRSFARAVDDELEGSGHSWGYVAHGRYIEVIDRLLSRYDAGRLKVVVLDDLRRDPDGTVREVFRFLGVNDRALPVSDAAEVHNPAFRFRSQSVLNVMLALRMWKIAPRLADAIDRRNRATLSYAPMEPAVRAQLLKHYREPNLRLENWLGRPLTEWRH